MTAQMIDDCRPHHDGITCYVTADGFEGAKRRKVVGEADRSLAAGTLSFCEPAVSTTITTSSNTRYHNDRHTEVLSSEDFPFQYASSEHITSQLEYSYPPQTESVIPDIHPSSLLELSRQCFESVSVGCVDRIATRAHDYVQRGIEIKKEQCIEELKDEADSEAAQYPIYEDELVCYGTLSNLTLDSVYVELDPPHKRSAFWSGRQFLQDNESRLDIVKLTGHTHQLLLTLIENVAAAFQFWICKTQGRRSSSTSLKAQNPRSSDSCCDYSVSITIYGPLSVAKTVGEWLDSARMCLQMPEECSYNVKYKNPHCLSFDEDPPTMTFDLGSAVPSPETQMKAANREDFAGLYTDELYSEAPQPFLIRSLLHGHQRMALTFLLERERGWDFDGPRVKMWTRHSDHLGQTKYRNTLSGKDQDCPPKEMRGGILADEMGLGKTCTMLSLIAMDVESKLRGSSAHVSCSGTLPATLIVVPLPLLQVWEKQIREHFEPGSVKWKVLHGSQRQSDTTGFADYDIVLTTYHMVTHEWKRYRAKQNLAMRGQLFSCAWHRVVLDEAHIIRNRETANSKSVCAIRSDRRWCVTGTPIQNRLSDIFGLLRFLDVEPYHHFKNFEDDILRPWRSQNDELSVMRLLSLMKALAIRRPRATISLPDKQEIVSLVHFAEHELAAYAKAREGAIDVIDAARSDTGAAASAYINAPQKINEMRYICNHGSRPRRHTKHARSDMNHSLSVDCRELSLASCVSCGGDSQAAAIDSRYLGDGLAQSYSDEASFYQLCKDCFSIHRPERASPLSNLASDTDFVPSPKASPTQRSSKIQALLTHLEQISVPEKSVVFSYWTSSLNAVAQALNKTLIPFLQYDGSMSRSQRDLALRDFARDDTIRVILVSITCGGQGLDLTVANNAFLLEPQWNPMLEEQAMSRVHRLGQTRKVRLVRFMVQGTWEQKIKTLQERKRDLVDLVVDKVPLKDGKDGKKQLHFLRETIV